MKVTKRQAHRAKEILRKAGFKIKATENDLIHRLNQQLGAVSNLILITIKQYNSSIEQLKGNSNQTKLIKYDKNIQNNIDKLNKYVNELKEIWKDLGQIIYDLALVYTKKDTKIGVKIKANQDINNIEIKLAQQLETLNNWLLQSIDEYYNNSKKFTIKNQIKQLNQISVRINNLLHNITLLYTDFGKEEWSELSPEELEEFGKER